MKRLLLAVLLGEVLTHSAIAQNGKTTAGFSFDVYGDSRSMMYLPYKQSEEAEARKLMVDMFELVLPARVADAVVQKDVKLIYDPASKELVQMTMPFITASEVTTLKFDKGWVTEASVEDVKLLPGVSFTMYHVAGGDWVTREVVKDVKTGQADFILSTGDLVWWGKQGDKPSESPYWKLVNEDVLKQLPPPDRKLEAAGLPGRVFTAVGNHEVWGDTDIEGILTLFPYLKKFGLTDKKFIYSFDYQGVRFIFLWTGGYDDKEPSAWNATEPVYAEQMKQLRVWLVFNGHVHTTELYEVDGVKYLLLGGGGAEQDPILPGRTHNKVPEGYPLDQYWKGGDPKEDYSYLHVDVKPGQPTKFTLNRFRPWSAEPFASVELFK